MLFWILELCRLISWPEDGESIISEIGTYLSLHGAKRQIITIIIIITAVQTSNLKRC
jgi:hypothetical protein